CKSADVGTVDHFDNVPLQRVVSKLMRTVFVTAVLMKMIENNRDAVDVRNRVDSRNFSVLDIPGGETCARILDDFYPFETLGPIIKGCLPWICPEVVLRILEATRFPVVEDRLALIISPKGIELHTKHSRVFGLIKAGRKPVRDQRSRS